MKLGDACTIDNGFAFNSKLFNENYEGMPIIRIRDIKPGYTKTFTPETCPEKYVIHDGDMLIGMDGEFNLVKWNSGPALLNQRVCRISSSSEVLLNDYLLYFLPLALKRIENQTSCVTVKHLSTKALSAVEIPIIPIPKQQEIAKQLSIINAQVDENKRMLNRLKHLVKSRFVEMFGDPCEPSCCNLPQQSIDSFCELRIGPFGSALHKEDYVAGGHPIVNPSHIIECQVMPDNNLTINESKYASMKPYHLHVGDVVLGRRGEIGRCAVVEEEGLLCGTGSMILRPNPALCRSDYLQRVVSFPSFASVLEREAVGVTMKNLNAKIVGGAIVALPPLALQQQFADFVAQVDKLIFVMQ